VRDTTRDRESGATLVEFTFVALLLFLLIFGIIGFGVVLSFKQTVTQSANEAARAAAVIEDDTSTVGVDERVEAAKASITQFEAWGRKCSSVPGGDPEMTCTIIVHDCTDDDAAKLVPDPNDPDVLPDCISVRMSYDYGTSPIVPNVPLVGAFMPDTVETTATAQLTFPG